MRADKYRQWILEKKVYRSRRRKRKEKSENKSIPGFDDFGSVKAFYTKFIKELSHNDFIRDSYTYSNIEVPYRFSLKKDYNGSVLFFKKLVSSYFLYKGFITLDFRKCEYSSIANFSLLEVVIRNLHAIKDRYNNFKYIKSSKEIKILQSEKDVKTNKYLHAFLGVKLPEFQNDGSKYLKLPLQIGKQRNYKENPKAIVSTNVVDFVNKSAEKVGVELNLRGRRAIEGLMGEVLGNAEDHSVPYGEWFVDGISFAEKQNETEVVDVNLTIMNVGPSMYEGFEQTKIENAENYNICQRLYDSHKKKFTYFVKFEREALFTLYLLNDGISRLKYKDESRGNGTMRFLESFIALGSFGEKNPKFKCELNVISGHTILTCDNDMHAFKNNGLNTLSLNKEKDFKELPDKNYLVYNTEYFPGTILECHIYLNEDYFKNTINS